MDARTGRAAGRRRQGPFRLQEGGVHEGRRGGRTSVDFSANSHGPFRKKLEQVQASIDAGDVEGLKVIEIKLTSSSPWAIARYRDLAIIALQARP